MEGPARGDSAYRDTMIEQALSDLSSFLRHKAHREQHALMHLLQNQSEQLDREAIQTSRLASRCHD